MGSRELLLVLLMTAGCRCGEPIVVSIHDPKPESADPIPASDKPSPAPTSTEEPPPPPPPPPGICLDNDGDGYGTGDCRGPDCDDTDPLVGPQAERSCYGGPDGTAGVGVCTAGTQQCSAGVWTQCTGEVSPSAELCDGVDNDCDGEADEEVVRSCYSGPEGTEGVGVCASGTQTCAAGQWGVCEGEVTPGAEVCDGVDNDCSGTADEALVRVCYSGPEGTQGVGACLAGTQTCSAGSWGACGGEVLPSGEVCDAVDNNCDGTVDEALVRTCYSGPSGTAGVGVCSAGTSTCSAGAWGACAGEVTPQAETCDAVDNNCDGSVDEALVRSCYSGPSGTEGVGACSAGTATCAAGAWGACTGDVTPQTETCDAVDNNCDGTVDEALTRACYSGPSGTEGVGACTGGTATCSAGTWGACAGEVTPATETCDAVDNNCDGTVDEALTRACYSGPSGTEGVGACTGGTATCSAGAWGACAGEVTPSTELCDAVDNNCDGAVDEALTRACYSGPSGTEGVGACTGGTATCSAGAWGTCAGEVTPASETCDAVDNNCDGSVDEALTRACYTGPSGTEGVGTCAGGTATCSAGAWGACAGEVTPVAETCDAQDNNCDGTVDEDLVRACYSGPTGTEGVGVCMAGAQVCSTGTWGVCQGEVVPQVETCDTSDNNCNGSTDENITRYSQDGSNQPFDPVMRPIDIIFVIDNSGSMTDEIQAVEQNINTHFAQVIEASGLDYRVIMVAQHGSATTSQSICVQPPLSGNADCSKPAPCPVNGPRFFHYSVEIGSHDSLGKILDTYNTADGCGLAPNGWSAWLRPGAMPIFIEITDDGPRVGDPTKPNSMDAETFEQRLFSLTPAQFGDATARDYIFHSIVGLKENSPALSPWLASDPLVYDLCTGNGGNVRQNGVEFQELSIATGGLRYPICEYQSFDAIFDEVARGIVAGAQMSCAFVVPSIPADSSIDNTVIEVTPTNGGAVQSLTHVADAASCTGAQFYTVGSEIHLCPDACTMWRNDPTAIVDVLFTCTSQIQP